MRKVDRHERSLRKPHALFRENVPDEMKQLPQWIAWRLEDPGGSKPEAKGRLLPRKVVGPPEPLTEKDFGSGKTKVPYVINRSNSPRRASSTRARDWVSGREAEDLLLHRLRHFAGVGFVTVAEDGIVLIDLDKCIVDGTPTPKAAEILDRFERKTFCELSPSGKGYHIFCYGEVPRSGKGKCGNNWVECYSEKRFFTVTGDKLPKSPSSLANCQEAIDWLYATYMDPPQERGEAPKVATAATLNMTDQDILDRAFQASNGSDVQALYGGRTMGHGDDHSSADIALCNHLAFWTQCNAGQMDRIFRGSGLMRPKWDEKRGEKTYGERTIDKAIANCADVYEPARGPSTVANSSKRRETLATEKSQQKQAQATTVATVAGLADPVPLLPKLPPSSELPSLGREIDEVIAAIVRLVDTHPAIATQTVLSACTLATQGLADVALPSGQIKPISNYFISIAESGDRKSTADSRAMQGVREWEDELRAAYDSAKETHDMKMKAWEQAQRQALKAGSQQDIETELRACGPRPQPPKLPQVTLSEFTSEGLLKTMLVSPPSMGLFSNEGGSFIGGYSMGKEQRLKTGGFFNKLWDGQHEDRIRAGDGYARLAGRRFSAHLMVQPNVASDFMSDPLLVGLGFTARCLTAYPETQKGGKWFNKPTPEDQAIADRFNAKIKSLLRVELSYKEHLPDELDLRPIGLSEDASRSWVLFYNKVQGEIMEGQRLEGIRPIAEKAAEHAGRLAAVLALFENPEAREIQDIHMRGGVALVEFYLNEALRLKGLEVPKEDRDADKLHRWIRDQWCGEQGHEFVSMPDLYQYGPFRSKREVAPLVQILENDGLVEFCGKQTINGKSRRQCWRPVDPDSTANVAKPAKPIEAKKQHGIGEKNKENITLHRDRGGETEDSGCHVAKAAKVANEAPKVKEYSNIHVEGEGTGPATKVLMPANGDLPERGVL